MENEFLSNLSYIEILFMIVALGCCLFGWKIMYYKKKARLAISLVLKRENVSDEVRSEIPNILIGKTNK